MARPSLHHTHTSSNVPGASDRARGLNAWSESRMASGLWSVGRASSTPESASRADGSLPRRSLEVAQMGYLLCDNPVVLAAHRLSMRSRARPEFASVTQRPTQDLDFPLRPPRMGGE
jgi:hypothetical protein